MNQKAILMEFGMVSIVSVICMISAIPFQAFSLEYGCTLQPNELNNFGTKLVQSIQESKQSLPDNIEINTEIEGVYSTTSESKTTASFEGFFRPSESDFLSIVPEIPVLGFDIDKDRIVVYACAHIDIEPKKSHLTIYFLRGYHLDPISFSNFIGNVLFSPSMEVRPIPASILGISKFKKFFLQIFRFIPFSSFPFDALGLVQTFFAKIFGDVTGFGVERVEVTQDYVKVSSGVDLKSPREALYRKTFNLKKPRLGPGIDNP